MSEETVTLESNLTDVLSSLIEAGAPNKLEQFLSNHHQADIAESLSELSLETQIKFFHKIAPEIGVEVLENLPLSEQIELILNLETQTASNYIQNMDPDDAADVLEELGLESEEKANAILAALPKDEAEDLKVLIEYEDGSVGSIMTSEFLAIPENLTVEQAIEKIKQQNPPDREFSFYVFITNKAKQLVGFTTLRNLLLASPSTRIRSIRNDYPIKGTVQMDQEEAARIFRKYDLICLPIVDENDRLVGTVTIDDVVDVVIEEATEDIYKLSGTSSEYEEGNLIKGSVFLAIGSRIPWLFLTIFGGLLSSYLIASYSSAYSFQYYPLALSLSFVPLLMGLGGNVGNQTSTIIVRSIATGVLKDIEESKLIFREIRVGFGIGLVLSSVVFAAGLIMNLNETLIYIVCISLLINVTVAAIIGSILPLSLKRLKIDPAIASAPFISSTLDVTGQLIYFAITLSIIKLLI